MSATVEDVLAGRAHVACVLGDALRVLQGMPSNAFHAGLADPPGGLAFMQKKWDSPGDWQQPVTGHGYTDGSDRKPAPTLSGSTRNPMCRTCKRHLRGWKDVPGCECDEPDLDDLSARRALRQTFIDGITPIFAELYRVLRPGSLCPVWAYPATVGWTQFALEDAGFRMYPPGAINHLFGQGWNKNPSQIRPGFELWLLAQKPWQRTQAANVERWGCGGMYPDEARTATGESLNGGAYSKDGDGRHDGDVSWRYKPGGAGEFVQPEGRVPTSVVLSHLDDCALRGERLIAATGHHPAKRGAAGMLSTAAGNGGGLAGTDGDERYMGAEGVETLDDYDCAPGCPVATLDLQSGTLVSGANPTRRMSPNARTTYAEFPGQEECDAARGADEGTASRFFTTLAPEPFYYAAKISGGEASAGCAHLLWARDKSRESGWRPVDLAEYKALQRDGKVQLATGNIHPTRKSARLTSHLARLCCPPGGVVINPFAGSGGEAVGTLIAHLEDAKRLRVVSIEQNPDYFAVLDARSSFVAANPTLFARRVKPPTQKPKPPESAAPAADGTAAPRAPRRKKAVQGGLFE